ncbi:MAG: lamin tail domain-containing protein [Planctomycetota bacterium]
MRQYCDTYTGWKYSRCTQKFLYDPNKPRVDEFNLNSTYSDKAYLRQNLAFNAYDWCGCPGSESFPMRAQRNGQFYGVQVFIEEPEEELLEREGFDPDGALYKMYNTFYAGGGAEKKTREWEGRSDLDYFCNSINNTSGITRHNNIFNQVNLPLTLNYLVATIITHQNDHPHKNHYLYCDSDGSGEWFFMPWDHDLTWGSNWTGSSYHDYIYANDDQVSGKPKTVKPSHPFVGKQDCQEWNYHWNRLIDALLNDATVRQMYLRRLRTVMDEFLKAPGTPNSELFIENRIDKLVAEMSPDVTRDYVKWANPWTWGGQDGYPRDQSFQYAIDVIKYDYLAVRRTHLFFTHNVNNVANYRISGSYSAAIPNAQPANSTINFGGYDYNPTTSNQDEEYIQLVNPNAYAVDISDWKLTGGVEHKFLPGTVIIASGSLYVSPNVAAFRSRATSPTGGEGRFVQGNYKGHLSSWGETINLEDKDGTLVNTITYSGNPSDQQKYLCITEIMYHPVDPCEGSLYNNEAFEYIELKNIGTAPLFLGGVRFTEGIFFTFPNISLPAGDFIVVVKNQAAFASQYTLPGGTQILGPYQGQLSNRGEQIKLEDSTNSTILEFDYKDSWYDITDGYAFSLTVKDPINTDVNDWGQKKYWRPSANVDGSPGWDDTGQVPELGSVKINELLAHSHASAPDWIELHNTTGNPINIGGWFLSDSKDNLMKYEIAEGITIDPCGYIVFYQDTHFGNPNEPGCIEPFALSENGETLYLHSGQDGELTGYSEEENFGASETGVSFGRYGKSTGTYNFASMSQNTPGLANAYPQVGPIVINEIMYHPNNSADAEYVEFLNISGSGVTLYDFVTSESWKFTDDPDNPGIEFFLPDDPPVTLEPDEYMLLVKDLGIFNTKFTVPESVQIFEWGTGRLDNAGEKIQLSMPGDMDKFGTRYYIRVDRVNYSDGSHPENCPGGVDLWPSEADGGGFSLTRKVSGDYGNDPNNWQAAMPSPGVANL